MAYSSSSSSAKLMNPPIKYDVFLSFRGEDTRNNFTSHLYAALCRKKIEAFIDNKLNRGDEISQSLLEAIGASMVSVVIFSKDYASSSWCLDELVKILECKNKYGRILIPVFYHVDPSNVRNQNGNFGDAFTKLIDHKQCFQEKLQSWRLALREAGKISGYHFTGNRSETELVEQIAGDILKKLNDTFSSPSDDEDHHLVGIYSRIKEIESALNISSKNVCIFGIWGVGGIGKTTIADAIFKRIFSRFEGYCFVSNIREKEEKNRGLVELRQKLLSTLLKDENERIDIHYNGPSFQSKRLSRTRVLIILDDITRFEQIELLIRGFEFAAGSQIIITTRDKHVLNICRVNFLYEVVKLTHDDALKLFSWHAFGQINPEEGFEELSNKVIQYTDGVPLALKILGQFLVGRSKEEWGSAIDKLKVIPNMDIVKVLKISYDGLDYVEQNIFLDIACFFQGVDKDLVIKFFDACHFSGKIGISVLISKSLISTDGNSIRMHDLLQEMGREIVRQESVNDPGKRSRLWHHEDIYEVLTYNTGTEAIEGISLDMSKVEDISINPHTFSKMRRLRFVKFYGENKDKLSMCASIFSRFFDLSYFQGPAFAELRYFEWHGYPLKSLPSKINPELLVSLEMPNSNIKRLWNGVQPLGNLKRLNVTCCKWLAEIPDLSLAQNLDLLSLSGCSNLIEVHSSIQHLNKLQFVSVSGCSNLRRFPALTSCNLEYLYVDETEIEEVPSSIGCLSRLVFLCLSNCPRLKSLPSSLSQLKSLRELYLEGCSNLQRLTIESGTDTTEVPSSIARLTNLARLSFLGIRGHEHQHPLDFLSYDGLHSLTSLRLENCGIKELPENVFGCHLSSLKNLYLDGNDFERIPESIIHLSMLRQLSLSACKRLKSLPQLPCGLRDLNADHCTSLESLSVSSVLSMLLLSNDREWTSNTFDLQNCLKLDRDELNKFVKDVLQTLELKFTTWYNDERDQADCQPLDGQICFPGSEIPEWLSYQSTGSSITLKLPPGCFFHNKFLGFTLCVVVTVQQYHDYDIFCECKVKKKDGGWHNVREEDLYVGYVTDYVRSDHVLLTYDFNKYPDIFSEYYDNNEAFFKFYPRSRFTSDHIECCEVIKKCGIHLFYTTQDFEESAEYYREVNEFDGEEPHPKRLKYSVSSLQERACP